MRGEMVRLPTNLLLGLSTAVAAVVDVGEVPILAVMCKEVNWNAV